MASIADLSYTDDFADNKKPFLSDLRASLDSIQTHVNDKIRNNLIQLGIDCLGDSYAFNDDGSPTLAASSVYDKQVENGLYTGGDFTISTVGAWTNLDGSNVIIAITPDGPAGDFLASFNFTVDLLSTNATNEANIRFRIVNGATTYNDVAKIRYVSGANASRMSVPVNIQSIATLAGGAVTFTLQYYIVTQTAMTIKVLANANEPISFSAAKI